jgi:hypothetical protein
MVSRRKSSFLVASFLGLLFLSSLFEELLLIFVVPEPRSKAFDALAHGHNPRALSKSLAHEWQ